jgi:hypothetical protein
MTRSKEERELLVELLDILAASDFTVTDEDREAVRYER